MTNDRIYPADVVRLQKLGALPLHIRIAWLRKTGHDGVGDAEKRLMRQMEWRVAAGPMFALATLCVARAIWGIPMTPILEHGTRSQLLAWLLLAMFFFVFGGTMLSRGAEPIRDFAIRPGNFGAELRQLSLLLEVSAAGLHSWSREDLRERARAVMIKHAKQSLVFEKKNEAHRAKRFESGWTPLRNEDEARAIFSQKFELLKMFELVDDKGWDAYFSAAKMELEKVQESEGTAA